MNITDKGRLYADIHRVLRPGGRFLLSKNMAGREPLHFPVPWAGDPSVSFLLSPDAARTLLTTNGFRVQSREDLTDDTAAAMRSAPPAASAPGLPLVLGEDFLERARNGARNLAERRARQIRAVLERV